ncbi:MAG: hypothetical protein COA88_03095 [Kordia sp.]|nr:MAG: hypothetical protein COA88_03095 [Kordia sp.]
MRYLKFILFVFLFCLHSVVSQSKIDSLHQKFDQTNNKERRLQVLDTLTKEMVKTNHKDQIKYLRKVIQLAIELENYDLAASKSRFIVYQLDQQQRHQESFALIDSMMSFKKSFKNSSSEGYLLLKRGGVYFALTNFEKAYENYQASIPLFYKSGDSIYAADAHYFSGEALSNTGDFTTSVKNLEKAKELYEILGDKDYAAIVELEIINVLASNGIKEVAYNKRKKILERSIKENDHCKSGYIYLNLIPYELKKMNRSVLAEYFNKATIEINNCEDTDRKKRFLFYLNIYKLLFELKEDNSEGYHKFFNELLSNELDDSNNYEMKYSTLAKASYYKKINEVNKAILILNNYFAKTKGVKINKMSIDIEKLASEVFLKNKNYQKAQFHLNNYVSYRDSVQTNAAINSYTYYQTKFETEEKEKEIIKKEAKIKELDLEKELAKNKSKMLWGGLIVLILIASGIVFYIIERAKRKQKRIETKLKQSKKDLEEFTKQLLIKGNDHEILKKEYEALQHRYGDNDELKNIHELSESKILTNMDWSSFKEKFKNVYPQFFTILKTKDVKFTNAEERLLALEKLEIKTNEIANILGISYKSVVTTRYRLRKKLDAPNNVDIIEYLKI